MLLFNLASSLIVVGTTSLSSGPPASHRMARIRHVISTVLLLAWVSMVTSRDPVYSNEWAVQVVGGQQEAVRLADKHGFTYGGKIFGDYHLFRHSHVSRRSTSASHQKHHGLLQENSVSWVEQQVWKERVPRSGRVTLNVCLNDPDWPKQEWYMNNCAGLDMHVTGAWLRGYLGEGVNVAVVDDGLQTDHPDLNYDATLSTDVVDGDRDPSHPADSTGHGTKVAGVATAIANNSLCGVGVAPQARVGGIRLLNAALTSDVNDAQDAQAYTFGQDSVDVYVSSWGPNDFGEVDGPGTLLKTALRKREQQLHTPQASFEEWGNNCEFLKGSSLGTLLKQALRNGATTGRGGKGNVYIFSSGNGQRGRGGKGNVYIFSSGNGQRGRGGKGNVYIFSSSNGGRGGKGNVYIFSSGNGVGGVEEGREGKGNVYIFSSGNGVGKRREEEGRGGKGNVYIFSSGNGWPENRALGYSHSNFQEVTLDSIYDSSLVSVFEGRGGKGNVYIFSSSNRGRGGKGNVYIFSSGNGGRGGKGNVYIFSSGNGGRGGMGNVYIFSCGNGGRGGKGNVYIFSSGNGGGGQYPDSCAFDGFVNNPYSLAFGSVSGTGRRSAHSEACSALIACVYAEDRNNPSGNKMVTTKTTSECTDDFFQSSAGAPVAGGILALALNANGALTWRDLKHLIVQTSQPDVRLTSSDANDWTTNAAGHRVSSYFGFGLLDASRLVDAARTWTTVPALQTCEMVHTHAAPGLHIPQTGNLTLTVDYSSRSCSGVNIRFLETAVLTLDYNFYPRGHLEATLTSPMGTRSLMLRRREVDIIPGPPVVDQDFMSVQFWGENPTGTWTFQLRNYYPSTAGNGTLNKWTLTLYGTETDPMGGNSLPATPGTTCVSDCSNASLVLPTPAATLLSSTLLASTVVGAASGGSLLTGGNMLGLLVASVYLVL
ncbi:hypothetical protein Bbelb_339130 [Branchiostoma belcheri]|nr:hypothetical protein Bbelb_339130 [Branchiostoma belcheri]